MPKFNVKFYYVEDGLREDKKIDAETPEKADSICRKEVGRAIHVLRVKRVKAA